MRIAFLAAAAVPALLLAGQAQAAITVIGSSPGYSCYQRAVANDGSGDALNQCDMALSAGVLSFQDEVATFVNRGIVKLSGGRHESAIADFDRAIQLNPNEPESYLNKGSAIIRMKGSSDVAIPLFNEALKRKTRKPELAYYARGIAHEVSGNLQAAYQDYKRASELAPRWKEPAAELTRFQVTRASSTR
jgi:tetratricopeptide (TPR) repeat protein